jgi:hypothetical protein
MHNARAFAARFLPLFPLIALFVCAALYLATLDDGLRPGELEGGDLITHQYAQAQGRPSNAPGYPLYTMGGWLWFRIGRLLLGPDANPIPILASYSTFWALIALALLAALIQEVIGRGNAQRLIAGLVVWFYGVTYFFWYYAVTTEQYTSSVAWTLAAFLLAFRWQRTGREGNLLGLALLAGVGLAHQLTVLIALPPLAWLIWAESGERTPGRRALFRPRLFWPAVGLAAAPLVSYLYVYLGGALHPEWRGAGQWPSAWAWFWDFVSTAQGRGELTWSLRPFLTAEFPSLIWGEMTAPGLLFGLLGLAALRGRRAVAVCATLGFYLAFCWVDRLGNWFQVMMPVYALLALGIAAGVNWALARARSGATTGDRTRIDADARGYRVASAVLLLGLAGLIVYRGAISYPRADARGRPEDTGLAVGWMILADAPAGPLRVLGTQAEALALSYLAEIWGARPDVTPATSDQARVALRQGQPVAVTAAALPLVASEVDPAARYSALGAGLTAVSLTPLRAPPAGLTPWHYAFGDGLELIGVKRLRPEGGTVDLLLVWQAAARPVHDWAISVRLMAGGREVAQFDRQHPVLGAYPTSRWSAGEVVADAYRLAPPAAAPGDGLTVIVYRQQADGSFLNLGVARFGPLAELAVR